MLPDPRALCSLLVLGAALVAPLPGPLSSLASSGVARAEGADPGAQAADLYRRATRLYAERKLADAEPLYRQAWQIRQSYEIASNFGALSLELGRPAEAAELLGRALSEFPVRGRVEERAALEARLAEARKLTGALRMKVSEAGADVLVDGRPVGRSPLPAPVLVEPGDHVVVAQLPGFAAARIAFHVDKGVTYGVTLPLNRPPAPRKRSAVPILVGGAVAVAAAGAGAALVGLAEAQRSSAGTLHDSIQAAGRSCAVPAPDCTALHGASSRADTLGNTGIAMFAVAGAAALGTATYVLWPALRPAARPPLDGRASIGVGALVGGGGALGTISGSF